MKHENNNDRWKISKEKNPSFYLNAIYITGEKLQIQITKVSDDRAN